MSESKILEGRNQSPAKDCRISTESELRKEIGPLQKTPGSETAISRDCIEREVDPSTGTLEQGSGELKRLYSFMPVMEIQDGILKVKMQVNNRNTWTIVVLNSSDRSLSSSTMDSISLGLTKPTKG